MCRLFYCGPELNVVTHSSNQYKTVPRQNEHEPKTFGSSFLMRILLQLKFKIPSAGVYRIILHPRRYSRLRHVLLRQCDIVNESSLM